MIFDTSLNDTRVSLLKYSFDYPEVHTFHIHAANHRYTTSTTETTRKSSSSSREIQVPPRSSHEGEGRGPYQEQNKEKQFKQAAILVKDSLRLPH